MKQLKAREWLQLGLMFPLVLWGLFLFGYFMSPSRIEIGNSQSGKCYLPLYSYTELEPYAAVLCSVPNKGLSIVRIHSNSSAPITVNHPGDVIVISAIFVTSVIAWLLFARRMVSLYVPGL